MDSTKTWIDFGYHVFDTLAKYILPVLGGLLTGWIAPTPGTLIKRIKGK